MCRSFLKKIKAKVLVLCGMFLASAVYAAPITYYFAGTMNEPVSRQGGSGQGGSSSFGTLPLNAPFTGSFTYDGSQPVFTPNQSYVGYYHYTTATLTIDGVTITDTGSNSGNRTLNIYNNPYPTDLFSLTTNGTISGATSIGGLNISSGWLGIVLQDVNRTAFASPALPNGNLSIGNFTTGNATFITLNGTSPTQTNEMTGEKLTYSQRGEISYLGNIPPTVPSTPVIANVSAGSTTASITFNSPSSTGGPPISNYTVISKPGNLSATGVSSPITITGLTNGVNYTFSIKANNLMGSSSWSEDSSSVTPANNLTKIEISGPSSINESSTGSYSLIGTYEYGPTATISGTLKLDTNSFATLSGTTVSTGAVVADQSIILRASYTENSITKTATLPIVIKNSVNYLTGIAINGASSLAAGGANSAYTVTATYDNGTTSIVPASLTASGVGAIFISGQLMSGSPASTTTVTLSATYTENGVTKTATLPVSITVSTTTTAPTTTTTVASTTTTTVISSVVSITKGWNLIGAGGNQPFKVSSIFSDTNTFVTVWKWIADKGQWAFYAPSMSVTALSDYALAKGYQVLDTIQGSDGFWVNASGDKSVTLPFGAAYTAVDHRASLSNGWNLISSGDNLTPVRFNNYLTIYSGAMPPSIGSETTTTVYQDNLTSLWAWDAFNSAWFFYAPSLDRSQVLADYVTSKGYQDFTKQNKKLGSGTGFWVNMPSK
jgi:hypothetical protein